MASLPIPAKNEWLRAGETLAIAAVGGIVLNSLGFPAGLVTGSLLGVAVVTATAAAFPRLRHEPVVEEGLEPDLADTSPATMTGSRPSSDQGGI